MGIHSFFKESKSRFKELFASESINESGDGIDTSTHRSGTNSLSSIFRGAYGGIRVKSAMLVDKKTGKPFNVPFWGPDYVSYPFVGITGYSDRVAALGQHGKMRGHLGDVCRELLNNQYVKDALSKVSNPIPSNSFIFYPSTPIDSVGLKGISGGSSLSVFNPKSLSAAVAEEIGPFLAEQAFTVKNGKLELTDGKDNGEIVFPATISSDHANTVSNKYNALWLDKITLDDLCGIVERSGGKDVFIRALEETLKIVMQNKTNGRDAFADDAKTKNVYKSGASYNPSYGKFLEFISKKTNLPLQKIETMLQQQPEKTQASLMGWFDKWLRANAVRTICEELVIPYYFPAVFANTYCMRAVTPELLSSNPAVKEAYEVYCKMVDGEANDFIGYRPQTDMLGESTVNESSEVIDRIEINSDNLRDKLMVVCRMNAESGSSVYMFSVRERTQAHSREEGSEKPHEADIKQRSFVRILNTGILDNPSDKIILSRFGKEAINQLFEHGANKYTLDYTPLFNQFSGIVDQNAKKVFNVKKVCGYIITFEYNPEIEKAFSDGEFTKANRLLDMYVMDSNGRELEIPALFSLTYFPEEDFIANGYAPITDSDISRMESSTIPNCLLWTDNTRKGVNFQLLDSFLTYGQRFNFTSTSNKNAVRADTITRAKERMRSVV